MRGGGGCTLRRCPHKLPPDAEDEPQRARPPRCEARRREGPGASQRWTRGLLERLSTASTSLLRRRVRLMLSVTDARRRSLTLILCCIAQFMVVLDVSIVNVALPSISADLGFDSASLAWVVNAYTLAFAGFLLLGGRAADLLGRREVFAGGLA